MNSTTGVEEGQCCGSVMHPFELRHRSVDYGVRSSFYHRSTPLNQYDGTGERTHQKLRVQSTSQRSWNMFHSIGVAAVCSGNHELNACHSEVKNKNNKDNTVNKVEST